MGRAAPGVSFRTVPQRLFTLAAAALLAACSTLTRAAPTPPAADTPAPSRTSAPTPLPLPTLTVTPSATPVPTLPALSLDQKIGQLLLVGINGTELTAATRSLISSLHVGGIVLRTRNGTDAAQVSALIALLQAAARESGQPPLFIAIDQEGGDVARLREGVTRFPSAMALGATGDSDLAYRTGYATALELLPIGINVNLAPVLDVLGDPDNTVIGTRAFGTGAPTAAEFGLAFLRGELDAGVIPVVKHYPGHGAAAMDSHAGLPALETLDTAPFDAAVAQGAPVVMVGHLWVKPLDSQPLPASLSANVLARLRQNFDGVILTDSLNMGAVTTFFSVPAAAVRSLQSGADWLIITEPGTVPEVVTAIRVAVQRGDLDAARLDEALRRVLRVKSRLRPDGTLPAPALTPDSGLAGEVARASIALANPAAARLPWSPTLGRILLLAPNNLAPADSGAGFYTYLAQLVALRGPRVTELLYNLDDPSRDPGYAEQAALYASSSDAVLFGAWDAFSRRDSRQRDALREVVRSGRPLIVVSLHTPFDLDYLGPVDTYLATFGPTRPQMEALVEVLFGDTEAGGVLPVINP